LVALTVAGSMRQRHWVDVSVGTVLAVMTASCSPGRDHGIISPVVILIAQLPDHNRNNNFSGSYWVVAFWALNWRPSLELAFTILSMIL
jgi:hypothetical protein